MRKDTRSVCHLKDCLTEKRYMGSVCHLTSEKMHGLSVTSNLWGAAPRPLLQEFRFRDVAAPPSPTSLFSVKQYGGLNKYQT
eukprot:scaffold248336_cov73-Cyclotella_meneghiniana.AAC.1